jgi:3-oxoacyl-[acyl-carrier protein] reductase
MDLQLNGRTALVTGASVGIGRAVAKGLAAEGVRLCVTARRRELLEGLAAEIVAGGGLRPHVVTMDMMAEDAPRMLTQEALNVLGQINILANCAGGSDAMPVDAPDEKWAAALTLNFIRVRQLILAVLPDMITHNWGRIINITGKSEHTRLAGATSAKAALHGFSKGLSRTVGKHGITINSIPPGRIMSEQIRRKYPEEFRAEQSVKDIPVGRYGEPEELACLAVFLASPVASYITGTVMPVDGGLRRYAF